MRLASLCSGGKDSTSSIARVKEKGHQVVCLITMHPIADDSLLFHYPNSWVTAYIGDALQIPLLGFPVSGRSKEDEVASLQQAIIRAKSLYSIDGVVFGGISSKYQKEAFEQICSRHDLGAIAPLWNIDPFTHMKGLVDDGYKIMIVAVSAMGLGKEWLGATLDKDSLHKLAALSKRYGFNLAFEGGEAETLVTDCPLFIKRLEIKRADTRWDGQRGIFEIREVALVEK
ncbi:MAG: diphthine--ammonia ligase [Nitrososphaera sp.]